MGYEDSYGATDPQGRHIYLMLMLNGLGCKLNYHNLVFVG